MDYSKLAGAAVIEKTVAALHERNIEPIVVETGVEALAKIKELIPAGASVMNGSSVTLESIGFVDLLKSDTHGWDNAHATIVAEKDPEKQRALRRLALTSDYYLGSVHALAETGQFIVASNTGSQLPHVVYSSANVIFVVGAQKIVPTLDEGMKRLEEYVVPLEEVHMQQKYGVSTNISKVVIFNKEQPMTGRKIYMILVKEKLGF